MAESKWVQVELRVRYDSELPVKDLAANLGRSIESHIARGLLTEGMDDDSLIDDVKILVKPM